MKTIESTKDLLTWSREINAGITLSRKCDMQDVYAHSKQSDIDKFFIESDTDRRLVLCSVYNTMSYEEVERLLRVLAKHKLNEMIREEQTTLDKEWSDLAAAKATLEESKRAIYRRINQLEKKAEKAEIVKLSYLERYNRTSTELGTMTRLCHSYKSKADKYESIKSLLA